MLFFSISGQRAHQEVDIDAAKAMQSFLESFQLGSGKHQSIYAMAMSFFWERLTNKLLPMLGAMQ